MTFLRLLINTGPYAEWFVCERSAEDAYPSEAPDPTFAFVGGLCCPTLDFVIAFWIMITFYTLLTSLICIGKTYRKYFFSFIFSKSIFNVVWSFEIFEKTFTLMLHRMKESFYIFIIFYIWVMNTRTYNLHYN
jgi:hypothetical protein